MTKLLIDEVYTKKSIHPMIVNFQNGYTTKEFRSQECCLLQNPETKRITVATELSGLVYAGEEQEEPLGRTLVLAKNRKTGKVRLIEVGCIDLKPVINIEKDVSSILETSNLELSRKFGSKKTQQIMEQREKLKVNINTVTEQMQNVTENITIDKIDLSSYNKDNSEDFYVPPIDRTADRPEKVYDINTILTENEYDQIYSELKDKDYKSEMLPWIKSILKKDLTNKQIVLAVYADSLYKLYNTIMKDMIRKSFSACRHSATLDNIILSNFTTMSNNRRNRPLSYKDRTLCYAIVMTLLINNLKFELNNLCQTCKLTPTNAATKVKVTGASVIPVGDQKIVQLKLPLAKAGLRRKSAKF